MMKSELAQDPFAASGEADVNLASVLGTAVALHEILLFKTADQLDGAVVLDLQTFGKIGDAAAVPTACPAQRQHKLMMLGFNSGPARGLFAEVQKAADLV